MSILFVVVTCDPLLLDKVTDQKKQLQVKLTIMVESGKSGSLLALLCYKVLKIILGWY